MSLKKESTTPGSVFNDSQRKNLNCYITEFAQKQIVHLRLSGCRGQTAEIQMFHQGHKQDGRTVTTMWTTDIKQGKSQLPWMVERTGLKRLQGSTVQDPQQSRFYTRMGGVRSIQPMKVKMYSCLLVWVELNQSTGCDCSLFNRAGWFYIWLFFKWGMK